MARVLMHFFDKRTYASIIKDPFEEYIRQSDPDKRALGYAWYTAIGLQDVDGLKTSDYLRKTAEDNINGHITLADASRLIESYYEETSNDEPDDNDVKQDIEETKQDIFIPDEIGNKTKQHIWSLFYEYGYEKFFGRSEVMQLLGITASPASALIKKMIDSGIIYPIKDKGKGKYLFR